MSYDIKNSGPTRHFRRGARLDVQIHLLDFSNKQRLLPCNYHAKIKVEVVQVPVHFNQNIFLKPCKTEFIICKCTIQSKREIETLDFISCQTAYHSFRLTSSNASQHIFNRTYHYTVLIFGFVHNTAVVSYNPGEEVGFLPVHVFIALLIFYKFNP